MSDSSEPAESHRDTPAGACEAVEFSHVTTAHSIHMDPGPVSPKKCSTLAEISNKGTSFFFFSRRQKERLTSLLKLCKTSSFFQHVRFSFPVPGRKADIFLNTKI